MPVKTSSDSSTWPTTMGLRRMRSCVTSLTSSLWMRVLDKLAAQTPLWAPGTASGYHPITIGYLAGELFRIVDGRTMGAALREDFAQPFDLDLWIGLPESEHGRVAQLRKPAAAPDLGAIDAIKQAAFLDRGSAPGGRGSTEWRMAEIPSANLHATAKDLARMMSIPSITGVWVVKTVVWEIRFLASSKPIFLRRMNSLRRSKIKKAEWPSLRW